MIRDVAEVAKLKEQYEGDILVAGSAQLVQSLVEHDLVEELRLMVFPVVLGAGKRLFGNADKTTALKVVDTKPAGATVILTLQPAR